ncbi:hypothetical protein RHGRI_031108 [Rhododendron griersonianum]|uniref:Uncharacterized protein n=1 Tax=Rhododendron griersonianum TaxID=479676 RepID=A0AAV6I9S3_9ERIC|nr:hypothetical protein RHGRI_031108 [Rhododendron griersonianum]
MYVVVVTQIFSACFLIVVVFGVAVIERWPVHAPFVHWDLERNASSTNPKAGIYYLETAQDQWVDCVTGISGQGKHKTYKPFDGFLQEYHSVDHCWSLSSVDIPQASDDTFLIMVRPHGFCLGMNIELGQLRKSVHFLLAFRFGWVCVTIFAHCAPVHSTILVFCAPVHGGSCVDVLLPLVGVRCWCQNRPVWGSEFVDSYLFNGCLFWLPLHCFLSLSYLLAWSNLLPSLVSEDRDSLGVDVVVVASCNRMVVHAPFVRWDLDWDASSTKPRAGIYYLETAQGQRVDCVASISRQGKHNTYKPFDGFLQEYHNILPLSTALEWNFRCQLAAWLDGIIYHSFLWYNEQGTATPYPIAMVLEYVFCSVSHTMCGALLELKLH